MDVAGKRVLLTGGAGFIGSRLCERLLEEGAIVTVVDDLSVGKASNLEGVASSKNFRFRRADVRDRFRMLELTREMDIVFHLAAQGLRVSLFDPEPVHEVNASGTLIVALAALKNGVQRLVTVSSSEVYGTAQTTPMSESHPCRPTTVYGASKLAGESYALALHFSHGLEVVNLRPFNCYGPRSHYDLSYGEVIPKFVLRALNGLPPVVLGDGEQCRDFIYVDEAADGILAAGLSDRSVGQTVNVARGVPVSIQRIASLVLEATGRMDLGPIHAGPRPGDVRCHHADVSRARELLGFEARISIEEGIGRYVEWFMRSVPDPARALEADRVFNWMESEPWAGSAGHARS